mmetsp:Transcript_20659/g.35001  ORF Transcript_20659/g.35001 Transcript_20659/m.35001 type:complete len:249 (-) Transcript_20659:1264-2010(-)
MYLMHNVTKSSALLLNTVDALLLAFFPVLTASRIALKRSTHSFLLLPGTPSAILFQRSFFSILAGYFLSISWRRVSSFSVQALSSAGAAIVSFAAGAEAIRLYFSMHSSLVLGSSCLHKLLMKLAIASHLAAPPAGYFLIAFERAASSSLVHGADVLASFASFCLSASSFRALFLASIADKDWRSEPAAVSMATSRTSARPLGPPSASDRESNSKAESFSHRSSTSSFIFSISSQTPSLSELSFGDAA